MVKPLRLVALLVVFAGCGPLGFGAGIGSFFGSSSSGVGGIETDLILLPADAQHALEDLRFLGGDPVLSLLLDTDKPDFIEYSLILVGPSATADASVLIGADDALLPLPTVEDEDGEHPTEDSYLALDDVGVVDGVTTTFDGDERLDVGLTREGSYTLFVRAFDRSRHESHFAKHAFTVDGTPPFLGSVIESLVADAPGQLNVKWSPAVDSRSGVDGYRVYFRVGEPRASAPRPGDPFPEFYTGGALDVGLDGQLSAATSTLLAGLPAGRTVFVQVTAVDLSGNETPLSLAGERAGRTRVGADGTFELSATLPGVAGADDVVVGDFDSNGVLDLVVRNTGTNEFTVLVGQNDALRRGNATFGSPQSFTIDSIDEIFKLDVLDLDLDLRPELLVLGVTATGARLLLIDIDIGGDGVVGVSVRQDLDLGSATPRGLAVGDFNDDKVLDVVVSVVDPSSLVRLGGKNSAGKPTGQLLENADRFGITAFSDPSEVGPVSVADHDGDGRADVVVAVGPALHARGGPFPALGNTATTAVGTAVLGIAVGDFDEDGLNDIVVTHADGTLTYKRSAGSDDNFVRFFPGVPVTGFASGACIPVVGDFNSDDILDIAVGCTDGVRLVNGRGSAGRGDGTFQVQGVIAVGAAASSIAVGDFNSDGIRDLVATTPTTDEIHVLLGRGALGRGDGSYFEVAGTAVFRGIRLDAAGDFNGDGILDVAGIALDTVFVETLAGSGATGRGDGRFVFAQTAGVSLANPARLVAGSFDGKPVAHFASSNGGNVRIHDRILGNTLSEVGSANFGPPAPFLFRGDSIRMPIPIAAHFNADGHVDVAILGNRSVSVLTSLVSLPLLPPPSVTLALGFDAHALAAGNFVGDLDNDLAVLDSTTGSIHLLEAFQGSFADVETVETQMNDGPRLLGADLLLARDLNLDGLADLVALNATSGSLRVIFARAFVPFTEPSSVVVDDDRALVLDEGRDDILAVDLTTGIRTPFSPPTAGANPYEDARDLVLDGGRLLLLDADAVLSIDLGTEGRTVLSDASTGTGTGFDEPVALATDGERLFVLEAEQLIEVDPDTGDRTVLTAPAAFSNARALSFDASRDRVLVLDEGEILVVDLTDPTADPTLLVDGMDEARAMSIDDASRLLVLKPTTIDAVELVGLADVDTVVPVGATLVDGHGVALRGGDVLVADRTLRGLIEIDLATDVRTRLANGPFSLPRSMDVPHALVVRLADVNRDGILDLIVLTAGVSTPEETVAPTVVVFLGGADENGRPTSDFDEPIEAFAFETETTANSMVVGDFNSDGIPDLAVGITFGGTASVRFLMGDGAFGSD